MWEKEVRIYYTPGVYNNFLIKKIVVLVPVYSLLMTLTKYQKFKLGPIYVINFIKFNWVIILSIQMFFFLTHCNLFVEKYKKN